MIVSDAGAPFGTAESASALWPKQAMRALDIAKASDGAFDPTLGALVDAWGFGPARSQADASPDHLAALRSASGWQKLAWQDDATLLQPGGIALDARPTERALRAMAADWSPWRAVAARLLWAYYRVAKEREGVR